MQVASGGRGDNRGGVEVRGTADDGGSVGVGVVAGGGCGWGCWRGIGKGLTGAGINHSIVEGKEVSGANLEFGIGGL